MTGKTTKSRIDSLAEELVSDPQLTGLVTKVPFEREAILIFLQQMEDLKENVYLLMESKVK